MSALLAVILSLFGGQGPNVRPSLTPAAPRPAKSTLTLRQMVGQRMVFAYDGLQPPPALRARIRRGEAAGVIVFARNVSSPAQLRATMRDLQAIPRPRGLRAPLIVMTDQERGPVRRIPGPPAVSTAQHGGMNAARADGLATARTLRGAGVNVDLAPVADLGRPGTALRRERRTHGRSPRTVSDGVVAFTAGLRAGGVAATAKHFPGLGASRVNTDVASARINLPLATLRAVDEAPFQSLIDADIELVMLATAVYPAVAQRPAALSSRWIKRELRGRLGFRGVTMTDDLGTPAVAGYGSFARRALIAARAGVDIPLFVGSYRSGVVVADGLVAAVRRGQLRRAALKAAARRVLTLRKGLSR